MTLKHALLMGTVVLGSLLAVTGEAAKNPLDHRRTLFVPVGQKTLILEAPKNMCFLDRSDATDAAMYKVMQDEVQKKKDQILLAVFGDCTSVAQLGNAADLDALKMNAGYITWMYQSVGETTGMNLADYLDMRESAFKPYIETSQIFLPGFKMDGAVHRVSNNVAQAMSGQIKTEWETLNGAAVVATTSVRNTPIEITIRYTGKEIPSPAERYALIDKMVAQEIALNE